MKIKTSSIFAFLFLLSASAFAQVQWQFINKTFVTGDTVAVDFYASGFTGIGAFQFTLKFDTSALRLRGTTNAHKFGTTGAVAGYGPNCFSSAGPGYSLKAWEIRTLWTSPYGKTVAPGVKISTIYFVAKKAGSICNTLQLWNAAPLWSVAYTATPLAYVPQTVVCAETPLLQQKAASVEREPQRIAASVFPNPTADKIILSFEPGTNTEIQVRLYDSVSRLVWIDFQQVAWQPQTFEYTMPETAGLYFLEVRDESGVFFVKQIIKQ